MPGPFKAAVFAALSIMNATPIPSCPVIASALIAARAAGDGS